jgi:hypothetical protein
MKNVSDKFAGKIKTHILCSITFFYRAAYEIMWRDIVEQATGGNMVHVHCMVDT